MKQYKPQNTFNESIESIYMILNGRGVFEDERYLKQPQPDINFINYEEFKEEINKCKNISIKSKNDYRYVKWLGREIYAPILFTGYNRLWPIECYMTRLINQAIEESIHHHFTSQYSDEVKQSLERLKTLNIISDYHSDVIINNSPKYQLNIYFNKGLFEHKLWDYFYINFGHEINFNIL